MSLDVNNNSSNVDQIRVSNIRVSENPEDDSQDEDVTSVHIHNLAMPRFQLDSEDENTSSSSISSDNDDVTSVKVDDIALPYLRGSRRESERSELGESDDSEISEQAEIGISFATGGKVFTDSIKSRKGGREVIALYPRLKSLILKEQNVGGDVDLYIRPALGIATYKDPETDKEVVVDLLKFIEQPALADTPLVKTAKEFLKKSASLLELPYKRTGAFSSQYRGNLRGPQPLTQREKLEKLNLPTTFQTAIQAHSGRFTQCDDRNLVIQKMAFIESMKKMFKTAISLQLENLQTRIDQHEENESLASDQAELKRLLQDFERLDLYALFWSLTASVNHSRETPSDEMAETAEELRAALFEHFKGRDLSELKYNEKAALSGYIQDIVSLLFINRWDYDAYLRKEELGTMTGESIETTLLRECDHYQTAPSRYSGKGILKLFKGCSTETQDALKGDLDWKLDELEDSVAEQREAYI